jgi:hypothetical protein
LIISKNLKIFGQIAIAVKKSTGTLPSHRASHPLIHALFVAFPQTGRFPVHSEPASNQPIFPPIGTGASDF